LPEEERLPVCAEQKHFVDTIKMIAYRAESNMASLLRQHIARPDDARALLRQISDTEADLTPDMTSTILTVTRHHLTQAAYDKAIEKLFSEFATQTIFPGTKLSLVFPTRLNLTSPRIKSSDRDGITNRRLPAVWRPRRRSVKRPITTPLLYLFSV
jgi:hypothetical protein